MADTFEDIVAAAKAAPESFHTFQPKDGEGYVTGKCEINEATRTVMVRGDVYVFPAKSEEAP